MKKTIVIGASALLMLLTQSCKKEYVTKDYITNNYITNVYDSEYYSTILNEQKEITTDIRPPYLKEGDTVAVCAASNYVTESDLADGIAMLKSWGLAVKEADNLYNQDGRYAGTTAQRIEGLQKMIDNPNVKAIIMARGGYGCAMTLPYLDLTPLESNPKWIVGYSDVTALLTAVINTGIEAIHGPMVKTLTADTESANSLKAALFGTGDNNITISHNDNCVNGTAEGRLVGGNLSMIYSLGGTLFDLNCKNAILFIEDTGEYNYAVDRMLTNLKLSGKLDAVKGIVVGDFITTQGSDKSIESIIADKVGDLNIPVMYGVHCGHNSKNLSLYLGRTVKMTVDDDNAKLEFE